MKKAEAELAPGETDEAKAERKDAEEEADDAAALQKARNWDEFKDDTKRGSGNRHNKG
jgi:immunoglobulin-binding protein 1